MKIAPSILAADLSDLAAALRVCEEGGADLVHVDVMDGHFVPNLTFGIPVIEALHRRTELPLDVHLMVSNPDRLLSDYLGAGAARIAIHQETATHLQRTITAIRAGGAKAGVALNPSTPVGSLEDILDDLDFVLLMSVNPGFAGQTFLPRTLEKARRLRQHIEERRLEVEIEMDGGIGPRNIGRVAESGVDVCVIGSEIFGNPEPVKAILEVKACRA